MDRIQEWVTFVGRRNVVYVVFAGPVWHDTGSSGSKRS